MNKVLVISASDSDIAVMGEAVKILNEFGVENEITISSAHRSPQRTVELVENFHKNGGKVIICGAGLAAHLAGVVAAHFPLPVIGIPLSNGSLHGMDALLATLQMPAGIPVASVALDGARNAGLLAIQILATSDSALEEKFIEFKKSLAQGVEKKAEKLNSVGIEGYLSEKK